MLIDAGSVRSARSRAADGGEIGGRRGIPSTRGFGQPIIAQRLRQLVPCSARQDVGRIEAGERTLKTELKTNLSPIGIEPSPKRIRFTVRVGNVDGAAVPVAADRGAAPVQ